MSRRQKLTTAVFFMLFFYALPPSLLSAGAPTEQIRGTVDNVLTVLKNPTLKSDSRKKERREQIRRIIFSRFDFAEMAKRSLGSYWRKLSPKEQDEFVRLFTDLLERAYVDQIEAYNDEKIIYLKESLDQDYAEVESRIITSKGEEISLSYRTHLADKEWRVYDVVVENISLVNNYRSQFNRVITNSSYEELLRRMREKQIPTTIEKK